MPYAKLSDVNIYYEEFGKGETVLFLHSHFSRALLAFSGQILPFQVNIAVYIRIFGDMAVQLLKVFSGTAEK